MRVLAIHIRNRFTNISNRTISTSFFFLPFMTKDLSGFLGCQSFDNDVETDDDTFGAVLSRGDLLSMLKQAQQIQDHL